MSVRNALFWSLGGQFVAVLALLVSLVVLARLLTLEEMGIFTIGQAIYGLLLAISGLGMSAYLLREPTLERPVLHTAFSINIALATILGAIVFASAPWVAKLVGDSRVVPVVRLVALAPVIGAFELLPISVLQREMRFDRIAAVMIVRASVQTGVAIAAAWAGYDEMSVAYAAVASALAASIVANLVAPHRPALVFASLKWRSMAWFGVKTLAVGGISVVAMRLADPVMAAILGLAALGVYSRASTIYTALYGNVFGAIGKVMFSRLADEHRNDGDVASVYLTSLSVIFVIMGPLVLTLAILARPVVQTAFGTRWLDAAEPLAILMLAQFLALFYSLHSELFILRDRVGQQAKLESFRASTGLALFAIGCQFGLVGAATARLIEVLLAGVLYVPLVLQLSGARLMAYIRVIGEGLLVSALAVAPVLALVWHGGFANDPALFPLAGSVALGGALWIAYLLYLNHPIALEIRRIVGSPR